jgi:hypothetical protein
MIRCTRLLFSDCDKFGSFLISWIIVLSSVWDSLLALTFCEDDDKGDGADADDDPDGDPDVDINEGTVTVVSGEACGGELAADSKVSVE